MTRIRPLLLAAFCAAAVPLAADWDDLYARRVRESLACRQAAVDLRQAELKAAQVEAAYLPYLEIATGGLAGISVKDGVLQTSTLSASMRFENILGADLTFSVPFTIGAAAPFDFGNPGVTLSRKIFDESDTETLKVRAALIRARTAMEKAASDVRLGLVSDVLDAYRAVRIAESNRKNLGVLERLGEIIRDETDRRAVQRRILQAQRAILQADEALQAIGSDVREEVEPLYAEAMERIQGWVREMPGKGTPPPASAELDSLRLDLEAAERERSFAFLPYVPNPTLSAGLSYDLAKQGLSWRLSLVLSYDALDRGEREAASFLRGEGPALKLMKLESAQLSLQRSVASAWNALEILDLDRRIQALDVEDARDAVKRWQALRARGFATEEDVVSQEIDCAVAELDAVKIEHDYLKQQLKLLQYYGSGREP